MDVQVAGARKLKSKARGQGIEDFGMSLVTWRGPWWGERERTLAGGEGEGEAVSKLESRILERHNI